MYDSLGSVQLKSGESVDMGVVTGPNEAWAERIENLLIHKGGIWPWQNSSALRQDTGIKVRFYVLHRAGVPFANMMSAVHQGVGHFGHVWTCPKNRRQGAAVGLMGRMMEHFRQQGGKALFLGTGYDSPAYHIYRTHGFTGLEAQSGYMEYYTHDKARFESMYFAKGACVLEDVTWRHWPASAALFLADLPGAVRNMGLGLLGRSSTEGPFLYLVQQTEQKIAQGDVPTAKVLVRTDSQAVVGLAGWSWDQQWPGTCLLDAYCQPQFWDRAPELLDALRLPDAERYVAYSDSTCGQKEQLLGQAGFTKTGLMPRRVALDQRRLRFADVSVWEKSS